MRRLVAALACRAHGTRLYGKPLQPLDVEQQIAVIEYMIEFVKSEPTIDAVVLGVAAGEENEPFHAIAKRHGITSVRGDVDDVLQRLIACGRAGGGTDVFRITTESPFIYFEPIPDAWRRHVAHGNDVTALAGVPDGPGFEMIRLDALEASHERGGPAEHVTQYIRDHQEEFTVETIEATPPVNRMDIRLTIDYPEDLVLCRRVYAEFKALAPRIPLSNIIEFVDAHPDLKRLVEPYHSWGRWYK